MLLPTIPEIISHLDIHVHGQSIAKRVLAKALYSHIVSYNHDQKLSFQAIANVNNHTLLIGPTGSGKTFLVKTLAKFLDIPFTMASCANLSTSGYVGESIIDVLRRLQKNFANKPNSKFGILFLDEFDKLASRYSSESNSVKHSSVQNELLTIFDSKIQNFHDENKGHTSIDMSKVIIIACGVFDGIEDIISKRLNASTFGFGKAKDEFSTNKDLIDYVSQSDLNEFGLISELVARITNFANLKKLSTDEIVKLLNYKASSPIKSYEELFDIHDIKIKFDQKLIKHIAEETAKDTFGLRQLGTKFREIVSEVDWDIDGLKKESINRLNFIFDSNSINNRKIVKSSSKLSFAYKKESSCYNLTLNKNQIKKENKKSKKSEACHIDEKKEIEKLLEQISFENGYENGKKWLNKFANDCTKKQYIQTLKKVISHKLSLNDFFMGYVYLDFSNFVDSCIWAAVSDKQPTNQDTRTKLPLKVCEDQILVRDKINFYNSSIESRIWWLLCEENALKIKDKFIESINAYNSSLNEIYQAAVLLSSTNPYKASSFSMILNLPILPDKKVFYDKNSSDLIKLVNILTFFEILFFNSFIEDGNKLLSTSIPKKPLPKKLDYKLPQEITNKESFFEEIQKWLSTFKNFPGKPSHNQLAAMTEIIALLFAEYKERDKEFNIHEELDKIIPNFRKAAKFITTEKKIKQSLNFKYKRIAD